MKKNVNIEQKRENEKHVVGQMISLYCRRNHHSRDFCPECRDLYDYCKMRIDKCPFMETKTFCSNCKVHCYKPDYREKIRVVMRWSGPRMLFVHPVMAIRHLVLSIKEKRRIARES